MPRDLPARAEIDPRLTWNLERVFPSREAWDAEFEAVSAALPAVEARRGRLGGSAGELLEFLERYWALQGRLWRLAPNATLPVQTDQNDQAARAWAGRYSALAGRWAAATAFVAPELLELGGERFEALVAEEPRLGLYRRMLGKLERRRAHVRSGEVEAVLGRLGEPFGGPYAAASSLTNADMRFSPVVGPDGLYVAEVAQSTIDALLVSPDREMRRRAFESYADGYLGLRNTLADLYAAEVKQSVFTARVRGYPSSVDAALGAKDEPREVLDAVVSAFTAHLPVWHRYWAARRRALGVEKLGGHDVFAPLAPNSPLVPYEQAVRWQLDGMAPLGEAYLSRLRRGLTEERWVDVLPNRGKAQGAFCAGAPGAGPFVFMSYTDDLQSVSTLAHELGHAMNALLSAEKQALPYAFHNRLETEIPSNFNQAMVRAHLLAEHDDPAFQLAVLEEAFYNFHRYFFQMPLLCRFELEAHAAVERGEGLTAERLNATMGSLLREGYGGEIEVDDRVAIMWAQFLHLYSPFYTFEYTVGISGAAALCAGILAGEPGARDGYLEFLAAGSSLPSLEALKLARLDLSTPAPIERGFAVLEGYVERLEAIVAARG